MIPPSSCAERSTACSAGLPEQEGRPPGYPLGWLQSNRNSQQRKGSYGKNGLPRLSPP